MQKNMSPWNALIRITCGLVGLAWCTACSARSPYRVFPWMIAIFSAVKVASGITRFCPITAIFRPNQQSAKMESQAFDTQG
ncbi:YgaP family membrane protein [Thermoflavimicrobium daqui]|jgi:hypothetical protein|uniref:DUF2892 domain-containing protein n=1 Tax=Thermoflavimicrobium daqui TaxID=2137476 RepID=A0A364K4R3_9BACL|nr:DUF2892 domain-containing protein [Thermoflavimicrobium daqui]RAL24355.1 DUF2892 domain-containing protein [Thermoflavimicrobium daqui]